MFLVIFASRPLGALDSLEPPNRILKFGASRRRALKARKELIPTFCRFDGKISEITFSSLQSSENIGK
jgi:hypothetical protein